MISCRVTDVIRPIFGLAKSLCNRRRGLSRYSSPFVCCAGGSRNAGNRSQTDVRRGISTISNAAYCRVLVAASAVKRPMAASSWCRVIGGGHSNAITVTLQVVPSLIGGNTHDHEMDAQRERSEGEGPTKMRRSLVSTNRFTAISCRVRSGSGLGGPISGLAVAAGGVSSDFSFLVTETMRLQNRSKVTVSTATLA